MFIKLELETLKDRAAVFLLDVQGLDSATWGLLNAYVHEGGGLVVGTGVRCRPDDYNGPIASQILPAQLDSVATAEKTATFGKIADVTHPLFDRYAEAFDAQFAAMPVYKYWKLKTPNAGRTLLTFADGAPALLERTFQGARTGRVLMWTTPLARRPVRSDPAAWNELPSLSYWAFPVMMNLAIPYLSGTTGDKMVFDTGEDVLLTLGPGAAPTNVRVVGPDNKTTEAVTPPPPGEPLRIAAPQFPGHWTVTTTGPGDAKATMGFSLNPPDDESRFADLEGSDLDSLFGKDGYALAGDDKEQTKVTDLIRVGHEIFPWLMFLILILVTAENYLANTFYKEPAGGPTNAAPAAPAHAAA